MGYTPDTAFDTTGTFNGVFKLNKFATTATTIGDPANYYNWAFKDSEIAADTIGTVKLSGVQTENGSQTFGIKYKTSATSIKVASADDNSIVGTVAASGSPIKNEFFVLDV